MGKAIRRPWTTEEENELVRFIKLETGDTIRWSKIEEEDRKANRILRDQNQHMLRSKARTIKYHYLK